MTLLNFRAPQSQVDVIDELADELGTTRSDVLRVLLADAVAERRNVDTMATARAQILALVDRLGDPTCPEAQPVTTTTTETQPTQ